MIQQRIGDLLEIEDGGKYYYVVVLTKVVMFGGNIVFAFHNEGEKREVNNLLPSGAGFNICTDLLWPKQEGRVRRMNRCEDVLPYWRTKLMKSTHEVRPGVKAKEWFIYSVDTLVDHIARVTELSTEHLGAMDSGCHSFDLIAKKVLARYTPDQDEHI